MASPSNDSRPRAVRAVRLAAPLPPLKVPVARSRLTPVVWSGSISSYKRPPAGPPPASSPNRMLPQWGAPYRVAVEGAGEDDLLGAGGQVDADHAGLGSLLFAAGDQPAGIGVIGPQGAVVQVGRGHAVADHPGLEALGDRGQPLGVRGRLGGAERRGRGTGQRTAHPEQGLGAVAQLVLDEAAQVGED